MLQSIHSLFIWQLPEQDNIYSNFAAHLEYHLASGSVCFIKLMRDSCGPWTIWCNVKAIKELSWQDDILEYWHAVWVYLLSFWKLSFLFYFMKYSVTFVQRSNAMCTTVCIEISWTLDVHICKQFTSVYAGVVIWAVVAVCRRRCCVNWLVGCSLNPGYSIPSLNGAPSPAPWSSTPSSAEWWCMTPQSSSTR